MRPTSSTFVVHFVHLHFWRTSTSRVCDARFADFVFAPIWLSKKFWLSNKDRKKRNKKEKETWYRDIPSSRLMFYRRRTRVALLRMTALLLHLFRKRRIKFFPFLSRIEFTFLFYRLLRGFGRLNGIVDASCVRVFSFLSVYLPFLVFCFFFLFILNRTVARNAQKFLWRTTVIENV